MRIQHNIAAMNSYRQYSNNTSAVAKNLEKLSSGYKINRAGDDAAGLAISEKMRAQITGLETAQKNAKDGISLVKTAEGALQEVHDMLNRMVTLATQSANGTYDNTTDRAQLQKEVDQLKTEINRIADSANFNGIQLLDGSMDANGRKVDTTTIFSGLTMSNNTLGTKETSGANSGYGGSNNKGGLELTGVDMAATAGTSHMVSDNTVRYHKDATTGGKTAFTVDLDGTDYSNATPGTKLTGLIFGLSSGETATPAPGASGGNAATVSAGMTHNVLFLDKDGLNRVTYDVTAEKGISSEKIATSIMEAINKNGGKVYIQVGTSNGAGQEFIEYNVTQEGDKLHFEMTDDGYNAAATAAGKAEANNKPDNYFQGNFNFGVNYKNVTETAASATGKNDMIFNGATASEAQKLEAAFTDAIKKTQQHEATSVINEGSTPMNTIYAEALVRFNTAAPAAAGTKDTTYDGLNDVAAFFKDGTGIQLGDDYYVFARSDEVYNGTYQDNVHVVDLRDLTDLGTGAITDGSDTANDLRVALDRLSVAAKDNEMFNVQVANGGTAFVVTERSTYSGDANLTMKNYGLESQIQKFDSATSSTTVLKEAGRALTLQIGDTSADYNQMKVNIKDIHVDSLGIEDMDISTQEGAAAAIDKIKSAINYVSDVRGTLGATQNRLEHTINNLSVMQENIQDAESTIRDTDIAQEMMAYTKNNILVQSAQAMLAQANQIPQGVLQLLG